MGGSQRDGDVRNLPIVSRREVIGRRKTRVTETQEEKTNEKTLNSYFV